MIMKRFVLFAVLAAAFAAVLPSCDKKGGGDGDREFYYLVSTPLEGSQYEGFTDSDMRFELVREAGGTYTLEMNRVHFVEAMPRLDITVPGIALGTDYKFSIGSIIPAYNGQPMPQYVMTGFELTVDRGEDMLEVKFDCFKMHVEYVGNLKMR